MRVRMLSVAVCLVAASCGGESEDLRAHLDGIKARPGAPAEPLPRFREPEGFIYEAAERRSPFAPLAPGTEDARQSAAGPGPDLEREREFLEYYSLDALRMVGSVRTESGLYGLMRTPDGLVHRLAPGDYLGRNFGRVVNISERDVQLVELVADGAGGYRQRSAAVALAD